jgi:hypothetical protein
LTREGERGDGEEEQLDTHRRARGPRNHRPPEDADDRQQCRRPIRRYHSGMSGRVPSVLGVRSYSDWKRLLPHVP